MKKSAELKTIESTIMKLVDQGKIEIPIEFDDKMIKLMEARIDYMVKEEVKKSLRRYLKKLMAE
jgi:osmotically-inducible protein OsmY